jgi:hypothetical protein
MGPVYERYAAVLEMNQMINHPLDDFARAVVQTHPS